MLKVLKKHWLIIGILIVVIGYIVYSCFQFIENQEKISQFTEEKIQYCESDSVATNEIEFCEHYLQTMEKEKNLKVDFFSMMTDILIFQLHFLNPVAFLLLIIPTLPVLCKLLKNRWILFCSTRESYNSFIKKFFKCAYRYIWLLPFIVAVLIFICMSYGTFDPSYGLYFGSIIWESNIIYHPILFILLYLLNITLYSSIFINLSLIVVRKCHHYIKAILLSYIMYLGLELFLEVVVNAIVLQGIFKTSIGHIFNVMNLFMFNDIYGVPALMLFTVCMWILSIIGVYFSYRNKESLILDCEKNV